MKVRTNDYDEGNPVIAELGPHDAIGFEIEPNCVIWVEPINRLGDGGITLRTGGTMSGSLTVRPETSNAVRVAYEIRAGYDKDGNLVRPRREAGT